MARRERESADPLRRGASAGSAPARATSGPPSPEPEARAVRVARLMRALDAGTYEPDPRKVAEAVLRARALRSLCGEWH